MCSGKMPLMCLMPLNLRRDVPVPEDAMLRRRRRGPLRDVWRGFRRSLRPFRPRVGELRVMARGPPPMLGFFPSAGRRPPRALPSLSVGAPPPRGPSGLPPRPFF